MKMMMMTKKGIPQKDRHGEEQLLKLGTVFMVNLFKCLFVKQQAWKEVEQL